MMCTPILEILENGGLDVNSLELLVSSKYHETYLAKDFMRTAFSGATFTHTNFQKINHRFY